MRLKAYTAATIAEAMQQIRDELGDDAAIVSTEAKSGGVRVIAAVDPAAPSERGPAPRAVEWPVLSKPVEAKQTPTGRADGRDALTRVFARHGVPESFVAELVNGRAPAPATARLSDHLDALFSFANLADRKGAPPILLAGPPGTGKTLAAAKLAARAVLAGRLVRVISTDVGSAGAAEQLSAFLRPLDVVPEPADGPAQLAALLAQRPAQAAAITIIDTRGINPFDAVELAGLAALIVAARADAVLVLGAGADARDSAEMAEAFASIGCKRLLATRLDLARRLGGIIAAAVAGRMALAETGASPIVAHGLHPLNAQTLARLLAGADS